MTTTSDSTHSTPIDARSGDLECMIGFTTGRYTRTHGPFWFGIALVLTVLTWLALSPFKGTYFENVIASGWQTNWFCILFTWWCLCILVAKLFKIRVQRRALEIHDIFPRRGDFVLSPGTSGDILARIKQRVSRPKEFLLFNRVSMALSNLGNIGEVRDVGAVLDAQADSDSSTVDSSYTAIRALIWTIPVLGFIGTVLGLGIAIGNFTDVISGGEVAAGSAATNAGSIREKLAPVVGGLATAFNTTLVALVAAVGVQLFTTFVYKLEEDLLDDCTQYCNDHIVSRLKLTNW
ncbi:MAG: MotA/TolQ/ExbB proton channel family protein [Phycisphaerales bacterium]|nr:MotA/TolQ/ExbB proton channel family protein [Phycisphaerales bacterium]